MVSTEDFLRHAGFSMLLPADPVFTAVEAALGAQREGTSPADAAQCALNQLPPHATNFVRGLTFAFAVAFAAETVAPIRTADLSRAI